MTATTKGTAVLNPPDRLPLVPPKLYALAVLADSPMTYLGMDAATLTDDSGNGHVPAYNGSWTTGEAPLISAGKSWRANGDQRTSWNANVDSWWVGKTLTLEVWVKLTTTASDTPLWDSDYSGARSFQFRVSGGKAQFIWWTSAGGPYVLTGATTLATGTIYHIAATYDPATGVGTLYLNGASDGTQARSGTFANGQILSLAMSYAGSGTIYSYANAWFDEVAIYPTALPAARILAHYQARL